MSPRYAVMDEHTLGYIHAERPGIFNILHASVLRGSTFDRLAGWTVISPLNVIRDATLADFDAYRVSSKGHLS